MRDQWPNRRGRIARPLAIQHVPGDTRISLHQLSNRQLSPGHAVLPLDCGNKYVRDPEAWVAGKNRKFDGPKKVSSESERSANVGDSHSSRLPDTLTTATYRRAA